MAELAVLEVFIFVMMSIALVIFSIAMIKRRDLIKWVPGLAALWLTYAFTNLEAMMFEDTLNFLEHFMGMSAAVLMFCAVFLEYYQSFMKNKPLEGSN